LEPPRVPQIFFTSGRGFAAYLIQVLIITSQPLFRGRWALPRRNNNAFLPQDDEQVSQSLGELRSLAIGVSRRDAFVELIG
jgi:Tfp pilus assembly protein PilN